MIGEGNPIYGKIFDSIYDGTLRANWQGLITFQQLIILADKDGIIDMTPHALHGRTGIPLEIIEAGLDHLSKPDPYSRSNTEEGRRIVLIDDHRPWGWRLVNHAYYNKLRSAEEKRIADRERMSEKREKSKVSRIVAESRGESSGVAKVAPITVAVSVTTDKHTSDASRPAHEYSQEFETAWKSYPPRAGSNPKTKAFKVWQARLKQGHTAQAMTDGTVRYLNFCKATGKLNTEYVMQAATFFGPDNRFAETWEAPAPPPKVNGTPRPVTDAETITLGKKHRIDARPGESMDAYRTRLHQTIERDRRNAEALR